MNRSPLFYPLNRGADADAGGAADLQTDVMRFMAILSLCLVAIFALVQSIPLAPVKPAPTPTIDSQQQPAEEEPSPPPVEIKLTRPAPVKAVVKEETIVVQRPRARPGQHQHSQHTQRNRNSFHLSAPFFIQRTTIPAIPH